jgi:UTP--glucose-1-phosphate uridylyltransferase
VAVPWSELSSHIAFRSWQTVCPDTEPFDASYTIVPTAGACYTLHLDYPLNIFLLEADAPFALFLQHGAGELESGLPLVMSAHVPSLVSSPPVAATFSSSVSSPTLEGKRWGAGIGAAILVNLTTFIGIVILAMGLMQFVRNHYEFVQGSMLSFSGGAILSTAFFLILIEASHLIGTGHIGANETETTWRWGAMVMAGFICSWVMEFVSLPCQERFDTMNQTADAKVEKGSSVSVENGQVQNGSSVDNGFVTSTNGIKVEHFSQAFRIVSGTVIGDGMHNLMDGFIIGIAFTHCNNGLAWSITASTIAHELAQELGDFVTLTVRAGLRPASALFVNFMCGTTVILGTVIAMAGNPSEEVQGLILAFGGGAYIQIGAVECIANVHSMKLKPHQKLVAFGLFVLGAIAIGLVLLDHEHCSAPGGAGGAGHGH